MLHTFLSYNKNDGLFTWKKAPSYKVKANTLAGCINKDGYWQIVFKSKTYLAHRLAWFFIYNEWPDIIDHKNRNRIDNRINNLKNVNHSANNKNTKLPKDNKSGVIGVRLTPNKKKWLAVIGVNGRKIKLGYFNYKEDAIIARKKAEYKHDFNENHGIG